MKKLIATAAFAALLLALPTLSKAQKMTPEEVIGKHLDSIAAADVRKAAKSLIAVGTATVSYVTPRNRPAQGRIVIASEGTKNFVGINFDAADYPMERFIFDGKNGSAAFTIPGSRSYLGNFVQSNRELLRDGLLGGVLSSAWAAENANANDPKMSFDGKKKIDGKEVYAIGYSPKGGGDMKIVLFFDAATFHHVRTEYSRTSSAGIGLRPEQSSGFNESRIKVTEDFGDFRAENGLTLPHDYTIDYLVNGQNGSTQIKWKFQLTEFAVNQKLDPQTFVAAE